VPKKMSLSYLVGNDEKDGRDERDGGCGNDGEHETLFMADIQSSSRRVVAPNHAGPAEAASKRKRAPSVSTTVSCANGGLSNFLNSKLHKPSLHPASDVVLTLLVELLADQHRYRLQ
jgi:hypothetical protein